MNDRRSQPPVHGRRPLPERRARERRVLWVGLLISVVVHLVGVGLAGAWLEPDPERSMQQAGPVRVEPPRGMRAVEIATEPEPAPVAEAPEPRPEPDPEPEREETVARARPADAPADTLSARDRLAPRVVDPRLWAPMVLVPVEPTLEEVEARIAAAVELLSDSALAEAEAALRARDWTVTDDEGGRWGISPGKLHLGKVTLPLPIWLPVDLEAEAENRRWYELDQALERTRILDTFEDRVRAIRERRDRERAERREAENGGG